MPFILTEPQRIEGTKLGFSIYPYHFSFQDKFDLPRNFNEKLVVFALKDSRFIEVSCKVAEVHYMDYAVDRDFVDKTLKNIIKQYPQFVTDPNKLKDYFSKENCIAEKEPKSKVNE